LKNIFDISSTDEVSKGVKSRLFKEEHSLNIEANEVTDDVFVYEKDSDSKEEQPSNIDSKLSNEDESGNITSIDFIYFVLLS